MVRHPPATNSNVRNSYGKTQLRTDLLPEALSPWNRGHFTGAESFRQSPAMKECNLYSRRTLGPLNPDFILLARASASCDPSYLPREISRGLSFIGPPEPGTGLGSAGAAFASAASLRSAQAMLAPSLRACWRALIQQTEEKAQAWLCPLAGSYLWTSSFAL